MRGVVLSQPFPEQVSMPHATIRLVPFLALGLVAGCGPSAPPARQTAPAAATAPTDHGHAGHDHDHDHDEPTSLADGVAKLEALSSELASTMSDEAVHGIGHLLEEVRELGKKAELPGDDAGAVSKALDELEECFGKVDEAFHSGDEKADPKQVLESVKERIEGAFKTIKEVL
jgi:hypothetical protein